MAIDDNGMSQLDADQVIRSLVEENEDGNLVLRVTLSGSGDGMNTDFSNAEPAANDIDMNGNSITNAADPVDPQDLATKAYVDTEDATVQAFAIQRANHTGTQAASTITGLAPVATSGDYNDLVNAPATANNTLSNLTSPTAINQHLLPNATNTRNIGASGNIFASAYLEKIRNSAGNIVLDTASSTVQLNGPSGSTFIYLDSSNRQITDGTGSAVMNFFTTNNPRLTSNGGGVTSVGLGFPDASNTANRFITVKAPNTFSAPWTLTLPGDDGTNGQVLTTDGSGGTSWQTVTASGTANQTLSNLTNPTAINQDLIFNKATPVVRSANVTGGTNSQTVSLLSGNIVNGTSGTVTVRSGDSAGTGASGSVNLASGDAGNGAGGSGNINISTGDASASSANSGDINLTNGNANTGSGGNITMLAGSVNGSNPAGSITLNAGGTNGGGASAGGVFIYAGGAGTGDLTGGAIEIYSGTADDSDSGYLDIVTGDSNTGASGNVTIRTGAAGTDRGFVNIEALFTILPRQAADPTHPDLVAGAVYYNSTSNKLKVYNGTTWETITSA